MILFFEPENISIELNRLRKVIYDHGRILNSDPHSKLLSTLMLRIPRFRNEHVLEEVDRIAIGHTRNMVGDRTQRIVASKRAIFRRYFIVVAHEVVEQILDQMACLIHLAHDLIGV